MVCFILLRVPPRISKANQHLPPRTDSVGNLNGALTMGAVVLILTWCCSVGITTTASRMTWSFARDKGTPFAKFLSKVDRRTKVPIMAVIVVCVFAMLLQLIYIGSYTAFNDIVSLTITGFYGSYLLPASFLLYHRIKGHVAKRGTVPVGAGEHFAASRDNDQSDLHNPFPAEGSSGEDIQPPSYAADAYPEKPPTALDIDKAKNTTLPKSSPNNDFGRGSVRVAQAQLEWGPWHLPEPLGTINNAYACCYMVFVIFWSVWPPATPVTAATMNYSVVVTGGIIISECGVVLDQRQEGV